MQLAHNNDKYRVLLKPTLLMALILLGSASITGCNKTFPPVSMPKEVSALTDETIQQTIKESRGYLLVHFTSYDPNCGYCVSSNPHVDELALQYHSSLKVARIHWEPWTDHTNRSSHIKKQFGIRGIPMFTLYKDGQKIWNAFGYTDETLNNLGTKLEQCCS